ncbi:hypothetical protein B5864_13740 [Salmonella enterica]|uniref:Uncharacterized protein n=2 Tax=Salmonella enterica TaxID=28901 RepID=A0A403T251_SALER|nr:hypothetical protein [Salmonella sp. SG203]EAB7739593.1 hypothetical protein [Salmonella enterica subsp. enterica serovar Hadar]EAV6574923.1 hypothetical protein [Salmonella enterica]EBR8258987.1 hypothetical protein [Salmonella enterica subsp. enterica serovar Cerro]EBW7251961.1 hypothetical protein [Salmonella enterica subsp. enterica serovar Gatow]EBX7469451.1 hypothetical protein [Salmonella enterica subsp. enterica serovar Bareilly]ECA3791418.1 hypothetical protein [Salmonella enteric
MAHCILMNIESLEYIRESADLPENGYDEVLLKFVCETPLTELDTCEMIYRYFGDVFFNENNDDFFIRKGKVSEMGGIISVIPPVNVPELKTGECIIPVIPELVSELDTGEYDPDYGSANVKKIVERQFGDLFDGKGELIVHK